MAVKWCHPDGNLGDGRGLGVATCLYSEIPQSLSLHRDDMSSRPAPFATIIRYTLPPSLSLHRDDTVREKRTLEPESVSGGMAVTAVIRRHA